MFNLFKKKPKAPKLPPLVDLDDNPLAVGDQVISQRYDLGLCRIVESENGIEYESVESGEKVSWLRMVDAATEKQKVNKVVDK